MAIEIPPPPLKQWQCGKCGKWIDAVWWRHSHIEDMSPSFEEMHAARLRGEEPCYTSQVHNYYRTGKEPTRDANQT